MTDDKKVEQHAKELIVSAAHAAQRLNDAVFQVGEFRKWPNESMLLATVYLAAGFASACSLKESEFLTLCRVARQTVRAEPKTVITTP